MPLERLGDVLSTSWIASVRHDVDVDVDIGSDEDKLLHRQGSKLENVARFKTSNYKELTFLPSIALLLTALLNSTLSQQTHNHPLHQPPPTTPTITMPQTPVTSIGIGNMGFALASALLKSSTPVTIWNRTTSRPLVQSLLTSGATLQPSIAAAISTSPVLLLCLVDYAAIYSALAPLSDTSSTTPAPLAGKTILNLTNGTPAQSRAMEAHLKVLGCEAYFDGGIMVTPQLVGTPASFVVLSGETEQVFQTRGIEELLKPIGAVQYVAEDAGAASLYDVAALAAMYGMFAGAFTGMALLKRLRGQQKRREGKDGEKVEVKDAVDGVMVPVLTALVPYVGLLAQQVDEERWGDSLGNPLAMQLAGVKNILQSCEEEGVDGTALNFLGALMERAVDEGFGEGGVAAVVKYLSN